jgi:hypothetical protein
VNGCFTTDARASLLQAKRPVCRTGRTVATTSLNELESRPLMVRLALRVLQDEGTAGGNGIMSVSPKTMKR